MEYTQVNISSVPPFDPLTMIEDGDSDEKPCKRTTCYIAGCDRTCDTDTAIERYYGVFMCTTHWREWHEHKDDPKWLVEKGLAVMGDKKTVKQWLNT